MCEKPLWCHFQRTWHFSSLCEHENKSNLSPKDLHINTIFMGMNTIFPSMDDKYWFLSASGCKRLYITLWFAITDRNFFPKTCPFSQWKNSIYEEWIREFIGKEWPPSNTLPYVCDYTDVSPVFGASRVAPHRDKKSHLIVPGFSKVGDIWFNILIFCNFISLSSLFNPIVTTLQIHICKLGVNMKPWTGKQRS